MLTEKSRTATRGFALGAVLMLLEESCAAVALDLEHAVPR
jgi:hypothetical protein